MRDGTIELRKKALGDHESLKSEGRAKKSTANPQDPTRACSLGVDETRLQIQAGPTTAALGNGMAPASTGVIASRPGRQPADGKRGGLVVASMAGNRANLVGSLWMVGAMAAFAVEDALVKAAAASLPVGEVLMLFGLGGAAVFTIVALAADEPLFTADVVSRPMRIRACFEVSARLFYVLALALTPLSATTAILQATPLVVVLGAALVFGETVGWQRWAAILVGLVGVLIVLRPGADSFSALSVLALIGMLGFAGRDLASRAAPRSIATSVLGVYGFAAIVVAGVLFSVGWEQRAFVLPDFAAATFLTGAVASGVLAYAALMKAMRTGSISMVTPFRYTRLLFGIALGVVAFGERLDPPMVVGSLVIVAAGIVLVKPGPRPARKCAMRT